MDTTKDSIAIVWTIEDVKGLDESLTDEECREVLKRIERKHDATVGINWDILQYHIDEIKREEKKILDPKMVDGDRLMRWYDALKQSEHNGEILGNPELSEIYDQVWAEVRRRINK